MDLMKRSLRQFRDFSSSLRAGIGVLVASHLVQSSDYATIIPYRSSFYALWA
jgi:hypothetical protein